ncbi:MAG: Permease of the drug/metabolite transporter (DMT) superfamily, partial [uncultured Thermomicrobiales bacterium]
EAARSPRRRRVARVSRRRAVFVLVAGDEGGGAGTRRGGGRRRPGRRGGAAGGGGAGDPEGAATGAAALARLGDRGARDHGRVSGVDGAGTPRGARRARGGGGRSAPGGDGGDGDAAGRGTAAPIVLAGLRRRGGRGAALCGGGGSGATATGRRPARPGGGLRRDRLRRRGADRAGDRRLAGDLLDGDPGGARAGAAGRVDRGAGRAGGRAEGVGRVRLPLRGQHVPGVFRLVPGVGVGRGGAGRPDAVGAAGVDAGLVGPVARRDDPGADRRRVGAGDRERLVDPVGVATGSKPSSRRTPSPRPRGPPPPPPRGHPGTLSVAVAFRL